MFLIKAQCDMVAPWTVTLGHCWLWSGDSHSTWPFWGDALLIILAILLSSNAADAGNHGDVFNLKPNAAAGCSFERKEV